MLENELYEFAEQAQDDADNVHTAQRDKRIDAVLSNDADMATDTAKSPTHNQIRVNDSEPYEHAIQSTQPAAFDTNFTQGEIPGKCGETTATCSTCLSARTRRRTSPRRATTTASRARAVWHRIGMPICV